MKFVIAISALNLVVSATTLAIVLIGARKAKAEVDVMTSKVNTSFNKIKTALNEIEI